MGNIASSGVNGRRRHGSRRNHPPPPPPPPAQLQPELPANRYVFAAATPYPSQYPNTNPPQYYQYPGYYPHQTPPVPLPLPAPYDHHHNPHHHNQHHNRGGPHIEPTNWSRYGYGPMMPPPPPVPYIEHQKAVTIKNDVNLKKETLKFEADELNPGKFLVSFTFDAIVAGRMTVIFFAKGEDCNLTAMKESVLPPIIVPFEQGLGQKFKLPSGTGIDFSMFEESELLKVDESDIYHLAVKAEALPMNQNVSDGNPTESGAMNSQITQAVFEKEKGEYQTRVLKQIIWVNGMRYELQEIYGIGNSADNDVDDDANDSGKECVICLSEPRDTTVLPCRHMCMCSSCAKVLRCQTNRCPICRQPVERLLEIKVSNGD